MCLLWLRFGLRSWAFSSSKPGAGKTTLLNALAGCVPSAKGLSLVGRVAVTGSNPKAAFLPQESPLFSQLTVRETLEVAARLRLPPATSAAHCSDAAERMIVALGLSRCADTRVGAPTGGGKGGDGSESGGGRGVSGGERRRLAVACELLAAPSLLFLDEPTSGLDSSAARGVVESLAALARKGRVVVASLHQPSAAVWALLDDVVLLSDEGKVLYNGRVVDHTHIFP